MILGDNAYVNDSTSESLTKSVSAGGITIYISVTWMKQV